MGKVPGKMPTLESRPFQNYAFRGWLSLEIMKLWLLAVTKTLFYDLDHKAGTEQHFHKSEKTARLCHHHKKIKKISKLLYFH